MVSHHRDTWYWIFQWKFLDTMWVKELKWSWENFAVAKQERRSACGCPSICHQQTPDNIIVSIAEVGIDNFEIDIMNIHANGLEWAAYEFCPPVARRQLRKKSLKSVHFNACTIVHCWDAWRAAWITGCCTLQEVWPPLVWSVWSGLVWSIVHLFASAFACNRQQDAYCCCCGLGLGLSVRLKWSE